MYGAACIPLELALYIAPVAPRECGGRLTQAWRGCVDGESRPCWYDLLLFGAMPGANLARSSLVSVTLSREATPGPLLGPRYESLVMKNA
jgi:hypothetical protein